MTVVTSTRQLQLKHTHEKPAYLQVALKDTREITTMKYTQHVKELKRDLEFQDTQKQADVEAVLQSLPAGCVLHVRGVGGHLQSEWKLREAFNEFGEVKIISVRVRADSGSGANTGWALVGMGSAAEAAAALRAQIPTQFLENDQVSAAYHGKKYPPGDYLHITQFSKVAAASSTGMMSNMLTSDALRKKIASSAQKTKVEFILSHLPLDYSFRAIASLSEVEQTRPRSGPHEMLKRLANRAAAFEAAKLKRWKVKAQHENFGVAPEARGRPFCDVSESSRPPVLEQYDSRWDDAHEQAGAAKTRDTLFESLATTAAKSARIKKQFRKKKAHQITKSLRMNNNELHSVEDLSRWLTPILLTPHELQWLDLSFNEVSSTYAMQTARTGGLHVSLRIVCQSCDPQFVCCTRSKMSNRL